MYGHPSDLRAVQFQLAGMHTRSDLEIERSDRIRDRSGTAQKKAVGHLHDVGLVDTVDLPAFVLARVVEGEAGDAGTSLFGDDLQTFDDARHYFVLDAGVEAFGIFANDDEVHIRITGRNVGKVADGTEVRVELETLPQFHVDTREPASDGSRDRAFQADTRALDRLMQRLRDVFLVFFEGPGACFESFPFEFHAGGFENAHRGAGDLRANAIAGDESDFMSHRLLNELSDAPSGLLFLNRPYPRLAPWALILRRFAAARDRPFFPESR